jgi:hypothetical protein
MTDLRKPNPNFPWECECGEWHRTSTSALMCRKCRDYLLGDWKPSATNLITGEKLDTKALFKR